MDPNEEEAEEGSMPNAGGLIEGLDPDDMPEEIELE